MIRGDGEAEATESDATTSTPLVEEEPTTTMQPEVEEEPMYDETTTEKIGEEEVVQYQQQSDDEVAPQTIQPVISITIRTDEYVLIDILPIEFFAG